MRTDKLISLAIDEKKHIFKVQFYLRKYHQQKGAIYFYISLDRQRTKKSISTGITIPPSLWDNQRKHIKGDEHEAENLLLLRTKNALFQLFFDFQAKDRLFTVEDIYQAYTRGHGADKTLKAVTQDWIANQQALVGRKITPGTFRTYGPRHAHLVEWLNESGRNDLRAADFGEMMADELAEWLFLRKGHAHNTAMRVVMQAATALRWAVRKGILQHNPMDGYEYNMEGPSLPQYLAPFEVERLAKFRFFSPSLQQVADTLLLQCWTSMDYADLAELDWQQHVSKDHAGIFWIQKQRAKAPIGSTTQVMHMPVMPEAWRILRKYSLAVPIAREGGLMSYDKYNKYLKEVAEILGFTIRMTTKTGRKTFINMMYERGVPLEDISDMVGHNSTRVTRSTYLRTSTRRIGHNLNQAFGEGWLAKNA